MRRMSRRGTILAATLVVGLLAAETAAAQDARVSARCPDGAAPRADLGIEGLLCRCGYEEQEDGSKSWEFLTEPEILRVRPAGAAAGRLQAGDRVIAVDGRLITTPDGGRAWSKVRPGDTLALRIRRGERSLGVRIVAGASCKGADNADPVETSTTASPRSPLPRIHGEAWLGLGLACDCSVDTGGRVPLWTFHDRPRVVSVAPGGPAAIAGIRPGDVLLRIDGEPIDTRPGGIAFSGIRPGQRVRMDVDRDGIETTVSVEAVARADRPESEGGSQ